MAFSLPPLPYAYAALEPFIDAKTMELHHTKHHQTYVDKLNAVVSKHSELSAYSLEDLLLNLPGLKIDAADKKQIQNHGGGHSNHSFFWQIMGPSKSVDAELVAEIEKEWQSVEAFKKAFGEKAAAHFGSGWMWLVRNDEGKLVMYATANQDSPLMTGHEPVIGLDVWEHAYYLKYQNRRPEYIEHWWNVVKLLP